MDSSGTAWSLPAAVPCLPCAGRDGLCCRISQTRTAGLRFGGLSGFHPLRCSPWAFEPKPGCLQAPCSLIQSLTLTKAGPACTLGALRSLAWRPCGQGRTSRGVHEAAGRRSSGAVRSGWPSWQRSKPGHPWQRGVRLECKGVGNRVPSLWECSQSCQPLVFGPVPGELGVVCFPDSLKTGRKWA